MLLTLFYLHYVQCDDAHLFRGTSFSHTRTKKERLIHKKLTVTKDKKARKYTRLFVCRRYLFRERRLRKTLSLEKQIRYEHNFAPNGAIVLIVLRTIFVFFEARDCCIECLFFIVLWHNFIQKINNSLLL